MRTRTEDFNSTKAISTAGEPMGSWGIARSWVISLLLVITLVSVLWFIPTAKADSMSLTPVKSYYYQRDTVSIALSTSHTSELFYVQIVNWAGATAMNWTSLYAPDGSWSTAWVLPLNLSEGQYSIRARSSLDHSVWCETTLTVKNIPSNASYVLYDMFEQPWREWWGWRNAAYHNYRILSNTSGNYTVLWTTYPNADHREMIYAPYRWNVTVTGYGGLSTDWPEFMPVFGPTGISGAESSLSLHFDYLNWSWWNDYWVPTWQGNPNWIGDSPMIAQESDGWYLGTVYKVTMNRQAAESLLGMPQDADPSEWWVANSAAFVAAWNSWIGNEGNKRLDIWCATEWPYAIVGTMMDVQVLPSGDIVLDIGHISSGYEVLMTRWLTETRICVHEPWYEDFTMMVDYGPVSADVTYDAVCQLSLHAVKANESASGAAWVWEPTRIDSLPSFVPHVSPFGSGYDPWKDLKYQSWNAGDHMFGENVSYERAPQWFNLTESQRLTLRLPRHGAVIGYEGVNPWPADPWIPPPDPIPDLYTGMKLHGYASLGYYVTDESGSGIDLDSMYDNSTKTLTVVGPRSFDNTKHPNGAIYHGAPWIEFNVTVDTTPPVADAGPDFSVVQGNLGTLDGTASKDDIGIVSWNWTIVDGSPQTLSGAVVRYRFNNAGIINVSLNVSDVNGNFDVDWVEVNVQQDTVPPVALATADKSTVEVGQPVTLVGTGSSDNVGIVNWTWTVSETTTKTIYGATVTHVFGSTGNYSVKLTVRDAAGLMDEDTITIQVVPENLAPIADAGPDQEVRVGATVQFDGTGSTDDKGLLSLNFTWEFYYDSRPVKLYGEAPEFTFEKPGAYSVTLTTRDSEGLKSTDEVQIVVEEKSKTATIDLTILGIIVVIVVAVLAALLWMRRRGAKPVKPERSS